MKVLPNDLNVPAEVEGRRGGVEVHALVLAAGRSSRSGGSHKLLATFDGVPLVRRMVETALASKVRGVAVVAGHRADDIRAALSGLPVSIVHNPNFADGLSSSLRAGFAAMPASCDAVLVMLADQPHLSAGHLDRLIEAFRPDGPGSLVVATDEGKWLNPVVIAREFAAEIAEIRGDKGAKSLLRAHEDRVRAIEIGPPARMDVDTLEAIVAAGGAPARS